MLLRAAAAEFAGGVDFGAVGGFELEGADADEIDAGVAMVEGAEGICDGEFGGATGVGFFAAAGEVGEGFDEFGDEGGAAVVGGIGCDRGATVCAAFGSEEWGVTRRRRRRRDREI